MAQMSDGSTENGSPPVPPDLAMGPEIVVATAQHGLECGSRAFARIANAMAAAGVAQMEMARALQASLSVDLDGASSLKSPAEAAGHWLRSTHARFTTIMGHTRAMNDHIASAMFSAAEIVLDGMAHAPGQGGSDDPAARRASAKTLRARRPASKHAT